MFESSSTDKTPSSNPLKVWHSKVVSLARDIPSSALKTDSNSPKNSPQDRNPILLWR